MNIIKKIKNEIEETKSYLNEERYLEEFEVKNGEELERKIMKRANTAEFEVGYLKGMELILRELELKENKINSKEKILNKFIEKPNPNACKCGCKHFIVEKIDSYKAELKDGSLYIIEEPFEAKQLSGVVSCMNCLEEYWDTAFNSIIWK